VCRCCDLLPLLALLLLGLLLLLLLKPAPGVAGSCLWQAHLHHTPINKHRQQAVSSKPRNNWQDQQQSTHTQQVTHAVKKHDCRACSMQNSQAI
jgi:hypothetical protein